MWKLGGKKLEINLKVELQTSIIENLGSQLVCLLQ